MLLPEANTTQGDIDGFVAASIDPAMIQHVMSLLTGLYERPLEAVVREYVCNAIDAHRAVGQTKPVKITLPSVMSPNLVIQDFGAGMTLDEMSRVFESFGSSTKRDTNDAIGGFGIGAKSAYEVSSQFTVTSRAQGVETVKLFLLKDSMPGSILISSHPTTEPSGVEISIPVDHTEPWLDIVEHTLKFFPTGAFSIDGKTHSCPLNERTNIFNNIYSTGGDSYIVMGGVAYPFPRILSSYVSHYGVALVLPVGSLELVPSREGIKDTPENRETLARELDAVLKALHKEVNEKLATCPKEDLIKVSRECHARLARLGESREWGRPVVLDTHYKRGRFAGYIQIYPWTPKEGTIFVEKGRGVPTRAKMLSQETGRSVVIVDTSDDMGWWFDPTSEDWDYYTAEELRKAVPLESGLKVEPTYVTSQGRLTIAQIVALGLPILSAQMNNGGYAWAKDMGLKVNNKYLIVALTNRQKLEVFARRTGSLYQGSWRTFREKEVTTSATDEEMRLYSEWYAMTHMEVSRTILDLVDQDTSLVQMIRRVQSFTPDQVAQFREMRIYGVKPNHVVIDRTLLYLISRAQGTTSVNEDLARFFDTLARERPVVIE